MPIEFIAFKKLHMTDDWKRIDESDNCLFTTFGLDNNKEYLYYVYYHNKKRIEKYCGLLSDQNSKIKAKEFEIEELEKQQIMIISKLKILRRK